MASTLQKKVELTQTCERRPTMRPLPCLCSILLLGALPDAVLAERFGHSVPMEEQKSGNYYVQARLTDGVETAFLVDTGSGYVSLSQQTFRRVDGQAGTEYVRDVAGAMADGSIIKVKIYRVATLALGDCVLRDVEVAVMPGAARDILGLSALRKVAPFALQLTPPVLMVSDCGAGFEQERLAALRD